MRFCEGGEQTLLYTTKHAYKKRVCYIKYPTCSRSLPVSCTTCARDSRTLCPTYSRASLAPCPTCLLVYMFSCLTCLKCSCTSCVLCLACSGSCSCLVPYILLRSSSLICFRCCEPKMFLCISFPIAFRSCSSCVFGALAAWVFYSLGQRWSLWKTAKIRLILTISIHYIHYEL